MLWCVCDSATEPGGQSMHCERSHPWDINGLMEAMESVQLESGT